MIAVTGATGQPGKRYLRVVAAGPSGSGRRPRPGQGRKLEGPWRRGGGGIAWRFRGLTRASGGDAVYLLVPPASGAPDPLAAQRVVINALAEAVGRSHLRHVVLLSSIGGQQAPGDDRSRRSMTPNGRWPRRGALSRRCARRNSWDWAGVFGAVAGQGLLPSFLPLNRPIEMAATAISGSRGRSCWAPRPPDSRRSRWVATRR